MPSPIAAAVGTEIHDSRRHTYAEQIHAHHTVTATITADNAVQQDWPINTVTVTARWSVNGAEHTDDAKAASTAKTGGLGLAGGVTVAVAHQSVEVVLRACRSIAQMVPT